MTLEDSIHSQRLRVLRDAERLGNVSEACRRHGLSRTLFYRWRQRFEQYGIDGVHPKRRQAAVGRPSALSGANGAPRDRVGAGVADLRAAVVQRSVGPGGRVGRGRDDLAPAAAPAARDAAGSPGGAGADECDAGPAHRAHRETGSPCGGERAGRPAVLGYVLRREAEGRGQGLADHRLRCRLARSGGRGCWSARSRPRPSSASCARWCGPPIDGRAGACSGC